MPCSLKSRRAVSLQEWLLLIETKSNKVAVVNGIAYPSNVNYQYGFECGVKYVNETEGKSVELVELPSYAGTDVHGENVGEIM